MAPLTVQDVIAEYGGDSRVLGTSTPRLSWRVAAGPRDWLQAAYEVKLERATSDPVESGVVQSADSVFVSWPFDPLSSRERVTVSVRVHGDDGSVSAWSDPASIEVGLLAPEDWRGTFVGPAIDDDFRGALHFRRTFRAEHEIVRAGLYIGALGVFEPYLNGGRVGDHVLDPGWTSYTHRILYSTFDVTDHIHKGDNALGVIVADGWYRGRIGFNGGRRNIYGDRLAVLAQLEIMYSDGTSSVVSSDDTWRARPGPIVEASLYDGETYDARAELGDWSTAGHDASDWLAVREVEAGATLEPAPQPPVRCVERIRPAEILRDTDTVRLDFGQNLVGFLRFTARGVSGETLSLRHAEVLENGELCVRPLRTALATETYILKGGGAESWEPRFTFHGFRYAEISGAVDALDLDSIEAVVVHSDLERTGWFECSHPDVNRLHENIVWSMRGNFVALPTDCPQRDERLGWTGDAQVFGPTACFLYDSDAFLVSWLADVAAEQDPDGGVPNVVPDPNVKGDELRDDQPAAAWADAAVIVPWTLYERYADVGVLEAQYDSMRRWVDYVESRLSGDGVWDGGWQYGDWLDPAAPADAPEAALTEPALVATAYAARTAALLAEIAATIGRTDDATTYDVLAQRRRDGFSRRFVRTGGRLSSDAQTAYALALVFDLVGDEAWRQQAAARLAHLVEENEFRIGTGFVGTPIVCDALSRFGYDDTAQRLLLQRECPSWLYPVSMGATTVWERWDSLLPDGSVNTGTMTSFNHYALGAVGDWLHRVVAGLAPGEPGYRRLVIRPRPGASLTAASARLRTPYGVAESEWRLTDDRLELRVEVPPNTRAEVWLPGADPVEIGSGSRVFLSDLTSERAVD